MGILEKNCGKHYHKECKNADTAVIHATEEAIKDAIHSNLNSLFLFLTESAVIRARKQELERAKNE